VLAAWLLLGALTQLPYLHAALAPPAGSAFVGYFFYPDDRYNYLSYVQQAEDGAFAFRNKMIVGRQPGGLVNVEWWLIGRLSARLGGRPRLAYQLFGAAAGLALFFAVDAWLRRAGIPDGRRFGSLLLVGTGGGLGGLVYASGLAARREAIDLWAGLFPFFELLVNPHFVIGTALLLWTLFMLVESRTLAAFLLGSALGLARPYDLVMVVGIHALAVLAGEPRASWRRLRTLLVFAPVAAYNYWLFYRNPSFTFFPTSSYPFPPKGAFALALGPAMALAALAAFDGRGMADPFRARLLAWIAIGGLVIAIHPVPFSLQFLVGVGVPLLVLGALGLARAPQLAAAAATLTMAASAAALLYIVAVATQPPAFVPAERLAIVERLAPHCRPGDLVLAPGEIGQYVAGLTSCTPYSSHPIEPEHEARRRTTVRFFGAAAPGDRARLLDALCVRFVVAPAALDAAALGGGVEPRAASGDLTAYERALAAGCRAGTE
jgi:hypothetical protein